MEYLKNNTIKDDVIDLLIDELYNYEGSDIYGCDLSYTLFDCYNVDGSITYSTYEAQEWIKKHFDELGEIVEEITFQLGSENIPNIFDEPEKFMVVIYLEVASYLCGKCELIDKNWNDKIKLNKKTIETIKKQLEELKEDL